MRFSSSNVLPTSFDCNGCVIGQRTKSDRAANANRLDGGRKPIGWRTETDWVADGNRSGGGRKAIEKTLRNRNNIAAGHTVMSSGYTLLYIGGFKGRVCHNSINAGCARLCRLPEQESPIIT